MEKKVTKTTTVKRSAPKQGSREQGSKGRLVHKKGGGSLDTGPNKPK